MSVRIGKIKVPRVVVLLGLTSLLTDVASEFIYPLLPIFLNSTLGVSVLYIGIIEGTAEFIAGITKFFSGYGSDRLGKRFQIVFTGYTISTLVRPLIGLAGSVWQVLVLRSIDRVGKGIRTPSRDAWLGSIAEQHSRGFIFGFHRGMDHAGAVIGPLLASVFLYFYPGELRTLFLLAIVPGMLALVALRAAMRSSTEPKLKPKEFKLREVKKLPRRYWKFLGVMILFLLGNSTDAFLLLKLKLAGVDNFWIPILWAGLHLVKMVSTPMGGKFSDRFGRGHSILLGWTIYALTYLVMGLSSSPAVVVSAFLFYGLFYGFSEGSERALVVDFVPASHYGTAFGLFHLVEGLVLLPASVIFGALWYRYGDNAAFLFGATLALVATLLFSRLELPTPQKSGLQPEEPSEV